MKLTAEARRNLPDNMFGLPKDREFPLIDANHIRAAILFFKFCPADKKAELAKNINKRAKELNMQLKISKDSLFYKYANKNIIKEDVCITLENSIDYENADISKELKSFLNQVQTTLLFSEDSLYKLEIYIKNTYMDLIRLNKMSMKSNVFEIINDIMHKKYIEFINSIDYISGNFNKSEIYNRNNLVVYTLKDIFNALKMYIVPGNVDIEYIKEKLDIILKIMNLFSCNYYVICRMICELIIEVLRAESVYPAKNYDPIKRLLNNFLKFPFNKNTRELLFIDREKMNDFINLLDMECNNTEKYLKNINTDTMNEINNMMVNMNLPLNDSETSIIFNVKDIIDTTDGKIINILSTLYKNLIPDIIKSYNKKYTLKLNEQDLIYIKKLEGKYHTKLIAQPNRNSEMNYFGLDKNRLFLYGKYNSDPISIIAIMLYNSKYVEYSGNAYLQLINYEPREPLKIFKIDFDTKNVSQDVLTEGLVLDEEGNIKFTLEPKKNFMDRYDECHKQLVSNWKTKNYEGVKNNLAFMFSLIIIIEREYIHKKGVTVPEDAIKARMFAINDFKTYTKQLKLVEPDFDFTKYYEESNHDKLVFKLSKNTVIGARKLFQAITMGL